MLRPWAITISAFLIALNACGPTPDPDTPDSAQPRDREEAILSIPGSNVLPIEVGVNSRELNVPFVTITICAPGTQNCRTVDHIQVDTGSTGLRLFSSVLGLSLPSETDESGNSVAECMAYGGGSSWWGPVVYADVVLGGETASRVPIQIWDNGYKTKPSSCSSTISTPQAWGANGTLGIGPALTDCAGLNCPSQTSVGYFSCDATSCQPAVYSAAQWVLNPISLLPEDNNGITIAFPALANGAQASAQGALIFGVGTESNNMPSDGVTLLHTTYDGWLAANFNGNSYLAKVDTGTHTWNLPNGSGLPACGKSGASQRFLCPKQDVTLSAVISSMNSSSPAATTITFRIHNEEHESARNVLASDDVGQDWGGEISNSLLLGMPFFYGKTVYFGFDGMQTPVGSGPFTAF